MKKLTTLILFLLIAQISFGQIDNTTKNKIKAYYFTAENLYEKGEYSKALDKISEIETFGVKLATSQNLKVKTLVKLKQYQKAKDELDALYSLNPNKEIYGDIAQYSSVIDDNLKAENEARENRLADQARLLKTADFGFLGLPNNLGFIKENKMFGIIDLNGKFLAPIKYAGYNISSPYYFIMHVEDASYGEKSYTRLYSDKKVYTDIYTPDGVFLSNVYYAEALHYKASNNSYISIKHLLVIKHEVGDDIKSSLYSFKHKKYILKDVGYSIKLDDKGVLSFEKERSNGSGSDNYTYDISQYLK